MDRMPDGWQQLPGHASGRLEEVVQAVLREQGAALGAWDAVALPARGSALYLLQGDALRGGSALPWSVVLKVLAPVAGHDDPAGIAYWRRESLLYGSGLLATLDDGLRAPRCHGCDEQQDGTVWLWLEYVGEDGERTWPLARWAGAARHLGAFNGAYLAGRPLPQAPWLGGQRLRAWLEGHHALVARIAAAPDNAAVRQWWPRPVVEAVLRLWGERDAFCRALERLPQTFGHGDAIRRNLFARRGTGGTEETVAIDWEYAGYYAPGEEVGQTLSVASAFYDVDPTALPALDEALFAGYLAGLREAGWRGDPRHVRFAYVAHAALRNAFNAVGASVPDDAGRASAVRTYGHTWEDLAARRAEVRPFLRARAEEARGLLEIL